MLAYYRTDTGKVRNSNEDSFVFRPPHLFAVADGMGGHVAGEVASKKASEVIQSYLDNGYYCDAPDMMLGKAIIQANKEIYEAACNDSRYSGMGTTLTAVYVNKGILYYAHVGDSRLYLLENNVLRQITKDHSLVGELVRNGNITKDEAHHHPNRNILTRAVGTSADIIVDTGSCRLDCVQAMLLCTDGLTTMVTDQEIGSVLMKHLSSGEKLLDELMYLALERGGYDNITMICAKFGDDGK